MDNWPMGFAVRCPWWVWSIRLRHWINALPWQFCVNCPLFFLSQPQHWINAPTPRKPKIPVICALATDNGLWTTDKYRSLCNGQQTTDKMPFIHNSTTRRSAEPPIGNNSTGAWTQFPAHHRNHNRNHHRDHPQSHPQYHYQWLAEGLNPLH